MTVLRPQVLERSGGEICPPSDLESHRRKDKFLKHPVRRAFLTGAASFVAMRPALAQSLNILPAVETASKLLASVPALGERSLGNEAAKVVMIEYASVTCTYSAAFNETLWPELKRGFVETGKLRLIFREFPMDRLALSAFMPARCIPEKKPTRNN